MTISTASPRTSFNCDGVSTVFPVPMQAYLATDFLVILTAPASAGSTELQLTLNSDYSLAPAGTLKPTAWSLTTLGVTPYLTGYTLQIIVNPVQTQQTQYVQNQAFPSLAVQTNIDRLTQMVQRLQDQANRSVRAPDGDLNPAMLLPPAIERANTVAAFDSNGNLSVAQTLPAGSLSQSSIGLFLYPTLGTEVGVTTNYYPYGNPRRYGAVGNGIADDTLALHNCIASNKSVTFNQGDIYGVVSVTWPQGGPAHVDFNGAIILGIATTPQTAVSYIQCSSTNFYDYCVTTASGGAMPTPNPNYTCGTWWFNPAPGGASQWNRMFGCTHTGLVRGMVYGSLPTTPATAALQSENLIVGWGTIGVSNPFFQNGTEAFIHFVTPIFFNDVTQWTVPVMPTTARTVENIVGAMLVNGGENIFSKTTAITYGCELQNAQFNGTYHEGAAPIRIIGDGVVFNQGRYAILPSAVPAFVIASGATGVLDLSGGFHMYRETGVGATDRTPLVDGTLSPSFEVDLADTRTSEWGWQMVGANVKLVMGCAARYFNHRLQITASDPNIYIIDRSPGTSLISDMSVDHMGYTTTGWRLVTSAGGTTLTNTAATGPTNYLPSQLTLNATGNAFAVDGDPTSLSTIQNTMRRVRPNEVYWASVRANITSGNSGSAMALFYSISGGFVATVPFADATSIGLNAWVDAEGPVLVPAGAAYMAEGVHISVSGIIQFTDIRVRRA